MKGKGGTRFSWDFLTLTLHVFFLALSPASLTEYGALKDLLALHKLAEMRSLAVKTDGRHKR